MGIGTLVNEKLFKLEGRHKVIFSSGVGYGCRQFDLKKAYKISPLNIYCLRGPMSADALGVERKLSVTDGGLLVGELFKPTASEGRISFMPHISSVIDGKDGGLYEKICKDNGICFIDPFDGVEEVLCKIGNAKILITEALHGAIVATSFGVPWIPVVINPSILEFKWRDWCATVSVEYRPYFLPALRPANKDKRFFLARKMKHKFIDELFFFKSLMKISKRAPQTVNPVTISVLLDRLQEKIDDLRKDFKKGAYDSKQES